MHRFALFASCIAFCLGLYAFAVFGWGYYRSISLPNIPRPSVGPGFSESATALFGGALVGWWAAALGVVFFLLGFFLGNRKAIHIFAGLPALVYFCVPIFFVAIPEAFRAFAR